MNIELKALLNIDTAYLADCKDKKKIFAFYLESYSVLLRLHALLIVSSLANDMILSADAAESIEKYLLDLNDKNAINIIQTLLPLMKLSSLDFLLKDLDLDKVKNELDKLKTYSEPQAAYLEDYLLDEWTRNVIELKEKMGFLLNWDYPVLAELSYKNFIILREELKGVEHKLASLKEVLLVFKDKQKTVSLSPLVFFDEAHGSLMIYSDVVDYCPMYERIKDKEKVRIEEKTILEEIGNFLMKCHVYNFSIELFKQLAENHPEQSSYKSSLYAAYCYLGSSHYKKGSYEKSADAFEKAMRIKDTMPQLYFNLSIVYSKLNCLEKAIRVMRKLAVKNSDNLKAFEMLGDLYAKQGQWQQALSLYGRTLELQATDAVKKKKNKIEENLKTVKHGSDKKEVASESQELEKILIDRSMQAELGKYHGVVGREKELRDMVEVLSCNHKNSLLIVGDAGVGKTALVEAFAILLISEELPRVLQEKKLYFLNIGQLLAGAKFRGQLEERIIAVLQSIKQRDGILFIDDVHNVFSPTAKGSASDIAAILRGWIIQGDVHCIGTTNYDEYRNSFEKETSVLRCFQVLRLEELTIADTKKVLADRCKNLEHHHGVTISNDAIDRCVELSKKCLRERFLPDKAIEVMDRAAARAALLSMKKVTGVDAALICEVVSDLSGIPLGKITTDEKELFVNLENRLKQRIIGQDDALSVIARVLRTAKAGMELNTNRPKGIFLFIGPTGVGKTEVAKALAELLFGTEEKLVRIDMSEYMERYSASRLIGTSPGYVGYYDQNQLVDKVRVNPYSLILLDEIDKADPQLLHLFLQVFDAGRLTDGRGKTADFNNCTVIMTSNAGTHLFSRTRLGYDAFDDSSIQVSKTELLKEIKRVFSAEFLNRIDEIVFYRPLTHDDIKKITLLKLRKVQMNLAETGKKLMLADDALSFVASQGYSFEYGARNLERVIRRLLLDPLAMLTYHARWTSAKEVMVNLKNNRLFFALLPEEGVSDSKAKSDYSTKEINLNKNKE